MRYEISRATGEFNPVDVTIHLGTEEEYRYFLDNVVPALLTEAIFNDNHRIVKDLGDVVSRKMDSVKSHITLRGVS